MVRRPITLICTYPVVDETLPPPPSPGVVCYTAVFSVVTQRSPTGGVLRVDTKNTFDHSPSNTFEGEGVGLIEMGGLYDGISSP